MHSSNNTQLFALETAIAAKAQELQKSGAINKNLITQSAVYQYDALGGRWLFGADNRARFPRMMISTISRTYNGKLNAVNQRVAVGLETLPAHDFGQLSELLSNSELFLVRLLLEVSQDFDTEWALQGNPPPTSQVESVQYGSVDQSALVTLLANFAAPNQVECPSIILPSRTECE